MAATPVERCPRLAVVLTKHDEILASGHEERVLRDLDRIMDALRRKHSNTFSAIESFITAASPKGTEVTRGAGLSDLLVFWLEPTEVPAISLRPVGNDRVFGKLMPREE